MEDTASVVVRPAVLTDAAGIARAHVESWRTTYRGIVPDGFLDGMDPERQQARWQRLLDHRDTTVWVAERSGVIVGHASGGPQRGGAFPGWPGEVYSIYLTRAAQGFGTGARLWRHTTESLRHAGLMPFVVWVLTQNPTVRFYEHMGGQRLAERPVAIGGVDLPEAAYGFIDAR
ncbi:MAG: GNAT family N-acetyltransferase [Thermaerobacter sp.]|nr:GNAT family N-acetyltransferase [Thermaerobacter sp.]